MTSRWIPNGFCQRKKNNPFAPCNMARLPGTNEDIGDAFGTMGTFLKPHYKDFALCESCFFASTQTISISDLRKMLLAAMVRGAIGYLRGN
jgi:hypothetical protein